MKRLRALLLTMIVVLFISTQAAAQCREMLQSHLDFLAAPDRTSTRVVSYKMTSNRSDSRYVSYTAGILKLQRDTAGRPAGLFDDRPDGGMQLFSDRTYTNDEVHGCTLYSGLIGKPFDAIKPDKLRVEVLLDPRDTSGRSAVVNMTLLSWGSGHQTFTGECRNGMIFGFVDNTIFTLSFFDTLLPLR